MVSAELVDYAGLAPGSLVDVETKNRHYRIECKGGSDMLISGHPDYCPTPVPARVLESGVIERGRHLHLLLNERCPVTTSRVVRVRVQRPSGIQ